VEGEAISERERYPVGVPCWVDKLQPDAESALEFYGRLFGWLFDGPGPMPGGLPGQYFVAQVNRRDVAGIGSLPAVSGPPVPSWNTYVRVGSADQAIERAKEAGGALLLGPLDALPAGRLAVLGDPAGAAICVWEARAREGAQLVNEPCAWTMSSLHTSDCYGANAFYEAVFGWQSESLGRGDAPLTLWRLPGYAGGHARQPMPRDVVAVMAPPSTAVPPHWNVNFLVDNADATAERVAGLDRTVILPPQDTPGFRSVILADPKGAAFSVSQITARP
jgi:predicted enzyme related to lactoylglutathione lyase